MDAIGQREQSPRLQPRWLLSSFRVVQRALLDSSTQGQQRGHSVRVSREDSRPPGPDRNGRQLRAGFTRLCSGRGDAFRQRRAIRRYDRPLPTLSTRLKTEGCERLWGDRETGRPQVTGSEDDPGAQRRWRCGGPRS